MAVMQNLSSQNKEVLMCSHLFGRDAARVTTSLEGASVSRIHAAINWQNGHWVFNDFSKNGTIVNGKLVQKTGLRISSGDIFKFGPDEVNHWQITDDSPPLSYLISANETIISLSADQKNKLPWPGTYVEYQYDSGWWFDDRGQRVPLKAGESINRGGQTWTFVENEVISETIDDRAELSLAFFRFDLSADEEHIKMRLKVRGVEMNLGERAHNYLCLTLARKRVQDMQQGYPKADQGWVSTEELLRDLSREFQKEADELYLNLHVHRFRKMLSERKPYGDLFTEVLERRKNEMRFAHDAIVVVKEGKVIIDTRAVSNENSNS